MTGTTGQQTAGAVVAAPPPIVTIASRFGAGGSDVGPRIAERLGVPFLDRVIDTTVAQRAGVSLEAVSASTEQAPAGVGRLVSALSQVVSSGPMDATVDPYIGDESRLRVEVEEFLAEASLAGGVILGRGANFVLQYVPGVLCVLLTGPRSARIEQVMRRRGLDRATAERETDAADAARMGYVRRQYGVEEDASQYHLSLDSTAFAVDTVVDLVVAASAARREQARAARVP